MVKEGYSKLNPVKLALAAGAVMAILVLLTTLASILDILGGFPFLITLIQDVYGKIGYQTTYLGAMLGAIFIFIDTFILTLLFALFYNWLIRK